MLLVIGLGIAASVVTGMLTMPLGRELMLKLNVLVDMCRRANPERFASVLAPHNPFVGKKFVHKRMSALLKADLSEFGAMCQRLQLEARKLDRRVHIRLWPMALYSLGLGVWWLTK